MSGRRWRAIGVRGSLGISVASLIVSVSLAELSLRTFRPVAYMAPPTLAGDPWRALVHRRSSIPGLAYELAPGARTFAQGAPVETNSYGMRDAEPLDSATPGLTRIAALGDSFTFGFGVPAGHTYPEVLERLLRALAESSRRQFEVLNMGVVGYSTVDEALVLRHKALALAPKLIVVGYFLNDPETDPIQPLHAYFQPVSWWQRFDLLRLFAQALHGSRAPAIRRGNYFMGLHAAGSAKWQAVETAFRQMYADAAAGGIPVLLVIVPEAPPAGWDRYAYGDVHRQVAAAAQAAGLNVLDLLPRFRRADPNAVRRSWHDHHFSAFGHEVAAGAILDKLRADYADLLGL